ncbi:hypothetical protein AVEN_48791-1 [Araneus ventricosus]|uniref:Uncharacterized protein n=1 Tax=Araneus ventricosus TaxID=182803 RepID=A0A4Y2IHC2_ARAVE|nr:hypothetical protein AVEN_48791-1 [Araneus ventricosus]
MSLAKHPHYKMSVVNIHITRCPLINIHIKRCHLAKHRVKTNQFQTCLELRTDFEMDPEICPLCLVSSGDLSRGHLPTGQIEIVTEELQGVPDAAITFLLNPPGGFALCFSFAHSALLR